MSIGVWFLAGLLLLAAPVSPEKHQAQLQLKEGQRLLATERFEAAAEAFREATRLDPLLMMAHYGLGQAHMALKQYPEAVVAFGQARNAFHQVAAESLSARLDNEDARDKRIRELRDRVRDNMQRVLQAGSSAARTRDMLVQQWELEISMLQRSQGGASISEPPAGFSLALGSAHFRNGQLAEAEREYRAAIAIAPKLGEPRNNLAVVLLLTGRPTEAQEQLRIAEKRGFKVASGLKHDVDLALEKLRKP